MCWRSTTDVVLHVRTLGLASSPQHECFYGNACRPPAPADQHSRQRLLQACGSAMPHAPPGFGGEGGEDDATCQPPCTAAHRCQLLQQHACTNALHPCFAYMNLEPHHPGLEPRHPGPLNPSRSTSLQRLDPSRSPLPCLHAAAAHPLHTCCTLVQRCAPLHCDVQCMFQPMHARAGIRRCRLEFLSAHNNNTVA
jgi:hypothetical protein